MTRQDNAKAIRAVVSDFKPLEDWSDARFRTAVDELLGADANNAGLIGRLQGKAEAYRQLSSLDKTTKVESER